MGKLKKTMRKKGAGFRLTNFTEHTQLFFEIRCGVDEPSLR